MIDDPDYKIFHQMFILQNMVRYHDRRYYDEDSPELTDAQYDLLFSKLTTLEKAYPHLVVDDSPTLRVGGKVSKGFKKIKHGKPMYSLKKLPIEDIEKWDKQMRKLLGKEL